jgi:hypothetical protein
MYTVSNDENGEGPFGLYQDYDIALEQAYDYGFKYVFSQRYYPDGGSTRLERSIDY